MNTGTFQDFRNFGRRAVEALEKIAKAAEAMPVHNDVERYIRVLAEISGKTLDEVRAELVAMERRLEAKPARDSGPLRQSVLHAGERCHLYELLRRVDEADGSVDLGEHQDGCAICAAIKQWRATR